MTDTPRTIAVLGRAGGIDRTLLALLAAQGDRVIVPDRPASLERHPVRFNTVGSGAVDTAFLPGGNGRSDESGLDVPDLERHRAGTPLGRVAEPLDIAGPIRFLLCEDAGFITGQVLWVNGGSYMR